MKFNKDKIFIISFLLITVIVSAIANYNKIVFRFSSLKLTDILTIRELLAISRSLSPVLLIFMFLYVLFFCFFIFRVYKMVKIKKHFYICVALISVSLFSFSFYKQNFIKKPKSYDKAKAVSQLKKYENRQSEVDTLEKYPHIFLILGEGFSYIPFSKDVYYKDSAVKNFKKIIGESEKGSIIVPNIGGGTADTEFDILTGISTRNYRDMPYSNMLIHKKTNSLPYILKDIGYKTKAVHPGERWFYKRDKIFKLLGFDSFVTIKSFEKDIKGKYVSEKATFKYVTEDFKDYLKKQDKPLFELITTIQNHGPYNNKYDEPYPFEFDISKKKNLNKKDKAELSSYLEGINDMDTEISKFCEFLNSVDEPVVVVYFGDHNPLLSKKVYNDFLKQDKLYLYKTPYFIWKNDEAKKNKQLKVKQDDEISSFFLGVKILEMLKGQDNNSYFSYLSDLKRKKPVILEDEEADFENTGYYILKTGR